MKILIVHNKYKIPGGEDSVVSNELKLLSQLGHQVEVLYFNNDEINTLAQKVSTGLSSVFNNRAKSQVDEKVVNFKPDVIHVHNTFPKLSPSIFYLAADKNIPIVQTIHNFRLICPSALLLRDSKVCEECVSSKFAYKGIVHKCYRGSSVESATISVINLLHNSFGTWLNKVSRFIVLSDFAKQKFLHSALKVSESQFVTKPNFVEDKGWNQDRTERFLFVGRLSTEKGIEVLLQAFIGSKFCIDIVGGGPLDHLVIEASKKHDNICYLGYQESSVVIKKMEQCKALIFPSIWYEGMPMTILEAFSTGCPVIASNLGAMAELIEHKVNGLHFSPGDAEDLSTKLNLVTGEMSQAARNSYLNKYTPEINYQQLINIYEQVIDEKIKSH